MIYGSHYSSIPVSNNIDAKDLYAGYQQFAYVDELASIHVWGSNTYGKLGIRKLDTLISTPTLLDFEDFRKDYIIHISFGKNHTLFLTQDLKVYSAGRNNHGQLGLGTYNRSYIKSLEISLCLQKSNILILKQLYAYLLEKIIQLLYL